MRSETIYWIYLINVSEKVTKKNIEQEFSGLRPIVASKLKQQEGYFSFASRKLA